MTQPEDTPETPTLPIDWPSLIAIAGRLGVQVWRVDTHGGITEVTEPPHEGDTK